MTQRDERIAKRAHDLWEQEGKPHGRHEDHWRQAAEDIAAETGGKTPAATAKKPRAVKAETAETAPKRSSKAAGTEAAAEKAPKAPRKTKPKASE